MLASRMRNEGADQGLPIIYIHGAMSNGKYWLMLSRGLADRLPGRAEYLIDLPGHGDSEGKGYDCIADYARALLDFMDEKDIKRATLVGHSMGGAIAQYVAINHARRVEKLGLLATGAKLGVSPQIIQSLGSDFESAVTMIRNFAFGPGVKEEIYGPIIEQMRAAGSEVAVKDFVACNAFDVIEEVSAISAPALVCCGEKDFLTSPKNNRRLAELLHCEYVEFADAGHMLPIERPKELTQVLSAFLSFP